MELLYVGLTISGAIELRVGIGLVERLPCQICEPAFDVASRYEDGHTLIVFPWTKPRGGACLIQLTDTFFQSLLVGIDQDDQALFHAMLPLSVIIEFQAENAHAQTAPRSLFRQH